MEELMIISPKLEVHIKNFCLKLVQNSHFSSGVWRIDEWHHAPCYLTSFDIDWYVTASGVRV